jgi:hydrogenase maturation protease
MSTERGPLMVLGIGNVLLRDDGVGVHVVRELERKAAHDDAILPRGTQLVDGGTLGMDLLPFIAGARAVLLVDAALLGGVPGDLAVVRGAALRARRGGPRAIRPAGIDDLLAAAGLADLLPEAISLVGVEPGEIATGLDLTTAVRAALPEAVAAAIGELWHLDRMASASMPTHWGLGHVAAGSAA